MATFPMTRKFCWLVLCLIPVLLSFQVHSSDRLQYTNPMESLTYHDKPLLGNWSKQHDKLEFLDVYDPVERLNRYIFALDREVDRSVLEPAVNFYKAITPVFVRSRVSDFFQNLREVPAGINSLLQFKAKQALTAVTRLAINSTLGIFGLFDPASVMGLHHRENSFANTLAFYGVGSGAYLVIPLLGPSSVRDFAGLAVDHQLELQVNIANVPDTIFSQPEWLMLYGINYRYATSISYSDFSTPFLYDMIRFLYTRKRELEIIIVDDKPI